MASSRKKQDEKNLKTLRELGALTQNKYCFDCNQRGPTYVNVTIGSFVCTKCSGMLRGLTPPHRVKSISMATFTTEEIDLLRNRGNEYCRRVWLGLYEDKPPVPSTDELLIRDFMVEKYERRRYYLEPSKADVIPRQTPSMTAPDLKTVRLNGINGTQMPNAHRTRPEANRNNNNNITNKNSSGFVADFESADIFSSAAATANGNGTNGFANFDNNPVFSNTNSSTKSTSTAADDGFSIFDICFTDSHGPVLNQVPLFPKCNTNRWSMPTPATFNNMNGWNSSHHNNSSSLNGTMNTLTALNNGGGLVAAQEDKYAALKDLDNELKSQKGGNIEWGGSDGSLYSSPTPTGSVYSSPSPQSSIFGSPSQGQFLNAFPLSQENGTSVISNPFSNGGINWGNTNGIQQNQQQQQTFANPFRDNLKMNGFTQVFQPIAAFPVNAMPVTVNGTNGWTPNPFKVGASNAMNSNNPFL